MNFENQVILITGASKGIGRCLAADLAKRGAVVIGCGRSRGRLQETLDEIHSASPLSKVIACDARDRAQIHSTIDQTLTGFGKIDVLINNAAIGMRRPFVETSLDVTEEIMRANFLGMVYCTHEVLPSMISRGSGHIVNI